MGVLPFALPFEMSSSTSPSSFAFIAAPVSVAAAVMLAKTCVAAAIKARNAAQYPNATLIERKSAIVLSARFAISTCTDSRARRAKKAP